MNRLNITSNQGNAKKYGKREEMKQMPLLGSINGSQMELFGIRRLRSDYLYQKSTNHPCVYSSVYVSIPLSQFTPLALSLLVTIHFLFLHL